MRLQYIKLLTDSVYYYKNTQLIYKYNLFNYLTLFNYDYNKRKKQIIKEVGCKTR